MTHLQEQIFINVVQKNVILNGNRYQQTTTLAQMRNVLTKSRL